MDNILEVRDGYIFHQVNCRGVMGAGLALQLKKAYPKVMKNYLSHLRKNGDSSLGTSQVVKINGSLSVVNVFGQENIGAGLQTDYEALEKAFSTIDIDKSSDKIYFPHGFGCGLAGGDWAIVEPLILKHFPNATIVKLSKV